MARRISEHATRISLITDAGTKHVDTYPTGGVAYGSLSMTNVSNALIRKNQPSPKAAPLGTPTVKIC